MKFLRAANRLVAINYYDTGDRTEFAYDGLGRRVKIVEYGPGVTATIQPSGSSYTTFTTAPFTLPAGSYSLTFQGLNPNGGDNVALIDSVALNGTLVANGSFESPPVTDYQAPPSDTAWSYTTDYSGIANDGGNFMSANPSAPAGSQVAFVKNTGLLSQIWSASAGTYTLSFKAAQRGSNNDSHQQLRVNLRPSSSVISTKNFVWCGNQICEERDASNSVTKRFFAEGEKRIGGSDAGNYFYSRDHLGSIREVTDSTGALKAQYDYDAFGNSVVVSGNMNVDFGFTGHYFHQPSGLNLALNRPYIPPLGRWMTRDPLKNAEMSQGPNLYAYVGNDPINLYDLLGLAPGDPYRTADEAGSQAILDINATSIARNIEYAGRIYQNPNGTFSYTAPQPGTSSWSFAGDVPDGTRPLGDYHTHAAFDPLIGVSGNEDFSFADEDNDDDYCSPGYLGTPSGDIKKYTPVPGRVRAGSVTLLGMGAK